MTQPLTTEQRRAFLSAPDSQRYYAASVIEEARQRIVRSIARCEGPALVVGAVGTGKSMLLAVLAEQFEPRLSVVTLPGAQLCTRRALLQMILSELHLPYRHMDEGELRLSILEYLRGPASSNPRLSTPIKPAMASPVPSGAMASPIPPGAMASPAHATPASGALPPRPRRMLLLVDEADALPTRLLEELRVLTNVVSHGMPLVSLVLAGGPVLEERFADPQLDMFSQRIGARCYLAPFSREETFQYVRSQVSAVGVKPEKWFDPEALSAIHATTGGVPRLVNQLGDQLVWLIEETGCQPLDAALVQQAWSDLQQLPAPWNTDAHSSLSSSDPASVGAIVDGLIEFGELDGGAFAAQEQEFDFGVGGDEGVELFKHGVALPMPRGDHDEDDLPASIPFSAARPRRHADLVEYAAAIDATESLVEQLDEFDFLELATPEPDQTPAPEPEPAAAENPFDEPFQEEETLVDPYSEFESQVLRSARQVLNRIDRTFAAELARCDQRRSKTCTELPAPAAADKSSAKPGETAPVTEARPAPLPVGRHAAVPSTPSSPPALHQEESHQRVQVVDHPPLPASLVEASSIAPTTRAAVVPGRQFRRLFTNLETAAPLANHG